MREYDKLYYLIVEHKIFKGKDIKAELAHCLDMTIDNA
tara:strand:+ start:1022 stop:1135 length:114 start_codon:yes stop_codon:yes gene_type:complete